MTIVFCFLLLPLVVDSSTDIPNLCAGQDPNGKLVRFARVFFPAFNQSGAECRLFFHDLECTFLAVYAAAWWYGQSVVRFVRSQKWITKLSPLVPLAIFLLGLEGLGVLDRAQLVTWPVHTGWDTSSSRFACLDVSLACLLILSVALADPASDSPSITRFLSSGLADLGIYSMSAYVLASYMFCQDRITLQYDLYYFRVGGHTIVPPLDTALDETKYLGSIVQLIVILAYPVGFMIVFGPIFQVFLAGCMRVVDAVFLAKEKRDEMSAAVATMRRKG